MATQPQSSYCSQAPKFPIMSSTVPCYSDADFTNNTTMCAKSVGRSVTGRTFAPRRRPRSALRAAHRTPQRITKHNASLTAGYAMGHTQPERQDVQISTRSPLSSQREDGKEGMRLNKSRYSRRKTSRSCKRNRRCGSSKRSCRENRDDSHVRLESAVTRSTEARAEADRLAETEERKTSETRKWKVLEIHSGRTESSAGRE